MPILVTLAGFEWGTAAGLATGNPGNKLFDSIVGSPAVVATSPRSPGAFSLEVTGAATGARNVTWNTGTLGAGGTVLVAVVHLYIATQSSGDNDAICIFPTAGSGGFIWLNSSGVIHAGIASGDGDQTGPTLSTNTWYRIDLKFDVSTGQTKLDWAVDGVAQTQATKTQSATTIIEFTLGRTGGSPTFTYRYDDVAVSMTSGDYPLGAHKVVLLSVAAGTVTVNGSAASFSTFTNNGTLNSTFNATTARNAIDEIPPTIGATADGWVQDAIAASDYVQMPMTSYTLGGGETVAGLRMLVPGWATSTTGTNIRFDAFNGTTAETVFALGDPNFDNSTTTPAWVALMLPTLTNYNTQTELDGLAFRAGFGTDANPDCGIHAIYAELAVKEVSAANGPATLVGAGALAATAAIIVNASATLAGAGATTATGSAGSTTIDGTATPTGVGSLTTSAAVIVPRTATLTGAGTLAALAVVRVPATATIAGQGSLAATVTQLGSATITGAGILAANGGGAQNGIATPAGVGTLAAVAVVYVPGTGSATGAGTLSAAGTVRIPGTTSLAAAGTLTAIAVVRVPGTATLTGVGSLTAFSGSAQNGTSTVAGTGSLTAAGQAVVVGAVALAGVGALTASGASTAFGVATLTGVGALLAGTVISGNATMAGAGALTAVIASAVITRPDTGVVTFMAGGPVTRPDTGTIVRPSTGGDPMPHTGVVVRPNTGTVPRS